MLLYKNKFECGCVVLDQTTILTAAHCVRQVNQDGDRFMDTNPENYHIAVGIKKKSNAAQKGVIPNKVIHHPYYTASSRGSMGYDIAIIKLPWKHRITYGYLHKTKDVGSARHIM